MDGCAAYLPKGSSPAAEITIRNPASILLLWTGKVDRKEYTEEYSKENHDQAP